VRVLEASYREKMNREISSRWALWLPTSDRYVRGIAEEFILRAMAHVKHARRK
jgi:hypothetical protein